ncbi:hypothetical protein ElyMa_004496800 [Elysia marginata]|uniref:Uncharacterized protein n=1 Tax=Elysia marginata TaxID=1093978 RepID=A0AAV4HJD6_9GAST|nr:hypothetical protein ElyMa_004496800 [Elysia marginata]
MRIISGEGGGRDGRARKKIVVVVVAVVVVKVVVMVVKVVHVVVVAVTVVVPVVVFSSPSPSRMQPCRWREGSVMLNEHDVKVNSCLGSTHFCGPEEMTLSGFH